MIDLGIDGLTNARRIGTGGSAAVFAATDSDGVEVAVKLLRWSADSDDARRQFEREQRALARLSEHPGVVDIYDSGFTDRGEAYLVMPLLVRSLQQRITNDGPLHWTEATAMIETLARTVEHAHTNNVLHRDIKPANILLDHNNTPLLSDFGIAKLTDTTASMSSQVQMTPAYSAPERFQGQPATPQSDVYALAATYTATVNGQPPFTTGQDDTPSAVMLRILDQQPPPPTGPTQIATVIAQAMTKNPQHRTQTALQLANNIATAITDIAEADEATQTFDDATTNLPGDETTRIPTDATTRLPDEDDEDPQPPTPTTSAATSRRSPLLTVATVLVAVLAVGGIALTALRPTPPADETASDSSARPTFETQVVEASMVGDEPESTMNATPTPEEASPVPGDLNGNGVVGASEHALLVSRCASQTRITMAPETAEYCEIIDDLPPQPTVVVARPTETAQAAAVRNGFAEGSTSMDCKFSRGYDTVERRVRLSEDGIGALGWTADSESVIAHVAATLGPPLCIEGHWLSASWNGNWGQMSVNLWANGSWSWSAALKSETLVEIEGLGLQDSPMGFTEEPNGRKVVVSPIFSFCHDGEGGIWWEGSGLEVSWFPPPSIGTCSLVPEVVPLWWTEYDDEPIVLSAAASGRVLRVDYTARTTQAWVNVRDYPSTDAKSTVLYTVSPDEVLRAFNRTWSQGEGDWVLVQPTSVDAHAGWISKEFIEPA